MIASILVVDDSKSSRKVNVALIRELVGSEVTCLEATGGEHALQILASQHVDRVLHRVPVGAGAHQDANLNDFHEFWTAACGHPVVGSGSLSPEGLIFDFTCLTPFPT